MTKSGTRSANEKAQAFAALLSRYLEEQGLSQKQAAFAIWGKDGNDSQLSRYIKAEGGEPKAPMRSRISKGLDIPLAEIEACFEDTPPPARPVYTIEEHEQRLEKLEARLRTDLERAHGAEKQLLKKQLDGLKERLTNLETDYERTQRELAEARTLLQRYENRFDAEKLRAAYAALDRGDSHLAEALFAEVQLSITQRLDDESGEAAQIAMQRAKLAEDDYRWRDAAARYAEAARLQPNFQTLELAATFHWKSGEFAEQARYNARLLDLALVEHGLHHKNTAVAFNNYDNACRALGRVAEAEVFVRRALAINQALQEIDQRAVSVNMNSLGLLLQEQGKLDEALAFHEQAYAICEKMFGEEDEDFLAILNNLGLVRKRQGKLDEAEKYYRRSLALSERVFHKTNPLIANRMNNLAGVLMEKGEIVDAAALMEQALEITEQHLGAENIELINMLSNLATVHCRIKKFDRAEPHFLRALRLCEIHKADASSQARNALLNYGCMLRDTDREAEAEHALKRVIQIDQGTGRIASAEHALALNHYAKMLAATNRPAEAAQEFRKAVAILKTALGVEHAVTKGVAANFANLHRKYPQYRESGDPQ